MADNRFGGKFDGIETEPLADVVPFKIREPRGPLDSPLGADLRKHQRQIIEGEQQALDGIRKALAGRWEFGRALLRRRKGKLLPRGLLDEVCREHGISRAEINHRMRFAETFDRKQLSNALDSGPAWRDIVAGLPTGRRALDGPKTPKALPSALSQIMHLTDDASDLAKEITDRGLREVPFDRLTNLSRQISLNIENLGALRDRLAREFQRRAG